MQMSDDEVTAHIRDVYWRLARWEQDWVPLARIRPLVNAPSRQVDQALKSMQQFPDVHLARQDDQKMLTQADRDAALMVAGAPRHLIAIDER